MTAFLRDLRYAIRTLRRTVAWSQVIVVSLAIGIGANTAIFSVAPDGANQPFNEGMGEWRVRHSLDLPGVEDAQIRLPLVEPIQGIVVRTEIPRRGLASSRPIGLDPQVRDFCARFYCSSSTGPPPVRTTSS